MKIKEFYDEDTFTLTYIVHDEKTKDAVLIDPVLNYDPKASKISFEQLDTLESYIKENELKLIYSIETHAHADHLSSSAELKSRFPGVKIVIGEKIKEVQSIFKTVFNFKDFHSDGSQFDILVKDKEVLKAGSLEVKFIETPGHTPACTSVLIEDAVFTGDALFMPDYGTGRCDFPAGSSKDLYHSIHEKLYKLPDETRVFVGHDYRPNGRDLKWQTTIKESKENNIQLKEGTSEAEYISFRDKRDATLSAPKLLLQSVQVNINAGHTPDGEDNGVSYLKMPVSR